MSKTFEFARLKLPIELQKPLLSVYKVWASQQLLKGEKHSQIEFIRVILNEYLTQNNNSNKL
jgi:hypothetical protein